MKKQTKNIAGKASVKAVPVKCCGTRQKIYGVVALVGLFACGLMIGVTVNPHNNIDVNKQVEQRDNVDNANKKTCEVIESILIDQLANEDSVDIYGHENNISVYSRLIANGCPENVTQYQEKLKREQDIISALSGSVSKSQTCEEIERLLTQDMPWGGANSQDRIIRAKIYANLSERGCAENSEKYVELAKQELQIARALQDDVFSEPQTIEVVETYKRLNMQMAAEEIFNKVKKLTNPAIDFILQVQKIIDE